MARLFVAILGMAAAPSIASTAALADSGDNTAKSHVSAGVEIGSAAAAQARLVTFNGLVGVVGGLGTDLVDGTGLHGYVDAQVMPLPATTVVKPYVSMGIRYYRHRYAPASIDELPDRHVGLRGGVGATWQVGSTPIELFGQGGPVWDFAKSPSCSLASGAWSICPHDDDRFTWHFAVGARYRLWSL